MWCGQSVTAREDGDFLVLNVRTSNQLSTWFTFRCLTIAPGEILFGSLAFFPPQRGEETVCSVLCPHGLGLPGPSPWCRHSVLRNFSRSQLLHQRKKPNWVIWSEYLNWPTFRGFFFLKHISYISFLKASFYILYIHCACACACTHAFGNLVEVRGGLARISSFLHRF